jgi:hypothetical protein
LLQLADDDDDDGGLVMLKVVKRARGWRQCASRSILQPNPLVGAEIERRDGGKEEEDHGMMLERKKSEGDEPRTCKYWLLPFAVYIKQYYSLWWPSWCLRNQVRLQEVVPTPQIVHVYL